MGDRTDCMLLLKEPATEELRALIEDECTDEHNECAFFFEEVNWGCMWPELESFIQKNQIVGAWTNQDGGSYGSGVVILPSGRSWRTSHGDIVLGLDELYLVEMAKADQAFLEELRA